MLRWLDRLSSKDKIVFEVAEGIAFYLPSAKDLKRYFSLGRSVGVFVEKYAELMNKPAPLSASTLYKSDRSGYSKKSMQKIMEFFIDNSFRGYSKREHFSVMRKCRLAFEVKSQALLYYPLAKGFIRAFKDQSSPYYLSASWIIDRSLNEVRVLRSWQKLGQTSPSEGWQYYSRFLTEHTPIPEWRIQAGIAGLAAYVRNDNATLDNRALELVLLWQMDVYLGLLATFDHALFSKLEEQYPGRWEEHPKWRELGMFSPLVFEDAHAKVSAKTPLGRLLDCIRIWFGYLGKGEERFSPFSLAELAEFIPLDSVETTSCGYTKEEKQKDTLKQWRSAIMPGVAPKKIECFFELLLGEDSQSAIVFFDLLRYARGLNQLYDSQVQEVIRVCAFSDATAREYVQSIWREGYALHIKRAREKSRE